MCFMMKGLFFILLSFLVIIKPYKILVYNPKFGYSHANFNGRIADILAERGHDVHVISVDMDLEIRGNGFHVAKIHKLESDPVVADMLTNNTMNNVMWEMEEDSMAQAEMLKSLINAQHLQGRRMIENKNLSKWVLEQKFDFAYTEAFNFYMLGLFKVWKIPYGIETATAMFDLHYSIFGIAAAPSYQPMQMLAYSDKMSYKKRVINLGTFMFCTYFYQLIREEMSSEIYFNSIYGEDAFDYRREAAASSFIFANSHPFLEIPFPKSAKMIEVGGIGIKKPKELNEYWLGILHQRENTVLISFGTVCKSHRMPAIMKNSIIETIRKRTEINFIWKYETPEDGLIPKLDNLILSKWVPQNDLLNHEKLSMFVTHGGMNSITELAFRGKRTLAIGIFGDQLKNVELVTRTKIGLVMNKNDLKDAQKFENNVMTVLHSNEFKENAYKLSQMLQKRPISSEDLLVKHFEFACQFPNLTMLDLESRNQSFIVYYLLDIIVPFILLLIALFAGAFYVFKKILLTIIRSTKHKVE